MPAGGFYRAYAKSVRNQVEQCLRAGVESKQILHEVHVSVSWARSLKWCMTLGELPTPEDVCGPFTDDTSFAVIVSSITECGDVSIVALPSLMRSFHLRSAPPLRKVGQQPKRHTIIVDIAAVAARASPMLSEFWNIIIHGQIH